MICVGKCPAGAGRGLIPPALPAGCVAGRQVQRRIQLVSLLRVGYLATSAMPPGPGRWNRTTVSAPMSGALSFSQQVPTEGLASGRKVGGRYASVLPLRAIELFPEIVGASPSIGAVGPGLRQRSLARSSWGLAPSYRRPGCCSVRLKRWEISARRVRLAALPSALDFLPWQDSQIARRLLSE